MKKNHKRLAATAAILFLVTLYIFTFITAFLKIENWNRLFLASAAATVFVPILVWIFIWLYGKYTDRHTMADIQNEKEE